MTKDKNQELNNKDIIEKKHPGYSRTVKIVTWVIAIVFVTIGGMLFWQAHESKMGVDLTHAVQTTQKDKHWKNTTLVGQYEVGKDKIGVFTYTTDKGYYASNFSLKKKKILSTSLINNQSGSDCRNPLIAMELLNKLYTNKVLTKPIDSITCDKKTITINGVKYKPNIQMTQLYGYNIESGKNKEKKVHYSSYNNLAIAQVGQQQALKKLNVDVSHSLIENIYFNTNKKQSVVVLLSPTNHLYQIITNQNGKVNVMKIG